MDLTQFRSLKNNPTVVAALIGGIMAVGLMIRHDLVMGGDTSYPLEVVFIGSLLAGFLARRNGGQSRSAGIAAAVIAILPMSLSVSTPVVYFLQNYGIYGLGKATATIVLFVVFIILLTAVTGSVAGGIGGWIGNKFTARSAA